jgi:hypothetical protein
MPGDFVEPSGKEVHGPLVAHQHYRDQRGPKSGGRTGQVVYPPAALDV